MTTISRHLTDMRCKAYIVGMWDNGLKNRRVRSEIKIDIAAAASRNLNKMGNPYNGPAVVKWFNILVPHLKDCHLVTGGHNNIC